MGNNVHREIIIDAKVKATLEGMDQVVSKLNNGLKDGSIKMDLTKGVGNSLSKQISGFKQEYDKFFKNLKPLDDGTFSLDIKNSKETLKSGEQIVKTFKELQRVVGNFENLEVLEAKKLFPQAFSSEVDGLLKGLEKLSHSMSQLDSKRASLDSMRNGYTQLKKDQETYQSQLDEVAELKIKNDDAKNNLEDINEKVDKLRRSAEEQISLKLTVSKESLDKANKEKQKILDNRASRGFNEADFAGSTAKTTKYQGKTQTNWAKQANDKNATEASKQEAQAALNAIKAYEEESRVLQALEERIKSLKKEASTLEDTLANIDKKPLAEVAKQAGGSAEDIKESTAAMREQKQATQEAQEAKAKYDLAFKHSKNAQTNLDKTTRALEEQRQAIDKLETEVKQLEGEVGTEALAKMFEKANIKNFNSEMLKSKEGIEQLKTQLQQADKASLKVLVEELKAIGVSGEQAEQVLKAFGITLDNIDDQTTGLKQAEQDLQNLKQQVLHFFSITNAVQLFKRAVTQALNTVKELDKTMTEAAVVTEFDIGDMWSKLPEYTEAAQELGVSINGMYQATTLYYQQGLKTNEAMALGAETMKMAKIAAMDSTDATTAMTAALRGFNMTLDETSAIRVNDVYSQLAAITAADVNQISTAIEKTASIAASANMEFETTAAFLAQIIETTQEAPETAGTALKTIIARFSEVKELKNQGLSTGTDEEGEEIDVNKIQKALRSVGISMDGFFKGTEGLDSVLLKLAEKWGTLDFETQRYIATMAAGSRQQSRFIAMMSDYGRTTQLVAEAQNSAGASQQQFEKTQESLETSLTRLKNAWDQFLMGLANNDILKGAVDFLTMLLNTINKVVDGMSGGNGLVKSLTSLLAMIGALKLGRSILGGKNGGLLGGFSKILGGKEKGKIFNSLFGDSSKKAKKSGQIAGEGFFSGFKSYLSKEAGTSKLKFSEIFFQKSSGTDELWNQFSTQAQSSLKDVKLDGAEKIFKDAIAEGKSLAEATDLAKNKLNELNGTNIQISGLSTTTVNMQALSEATMGVGVILGGLAAIFQALEMDGLAKGFSIASAAAMTLGSTMGALNMIVKATGGSFTGVGIQIGAAGVIAKIPWIEFIAILAAVLAAIVVVTVGVRQFQKASKSFQLKELQKNISKTNENLEETKSKVEEIANERKELENLQSGFESLARGTDAWKRQLIEANSKVLELVEKYQILSDYIATGAEGQLVIQAAGWDALEKEQNQIITNLSNLLLNQSLEHQKVQRGQSFDSHVSSMQDNRFMNGLVGLLNQTTDFLDTGFGKGLSVWAAAMSQQYWLIPQVINQDLSEEYDKKWTGGLTEEQYSKLATSMYEAGIYFTENMTADQLTEARGQTLKIYSDLGYDLELFNSVFDKITKSEFTNYGEQESRAKYTEEQYKDSFIYGAVNSNEKVSGTIYGDAIADVMAEIYDSKDIEDKKKAKSEELKGQTDEWIKQEYARLYGKTYADGKVYSDSSLTEVVDVSVNYMRESVATKLVAEDFGIDAEKIAKILEGKDDKQIKLFEDIFGKSGENISSQDFKKYLDGNGIPNMEQIAQDMGFQAEEGLTAFQQMAESMGVTAQDLSKILINNFKTAQDKITKNRKSIVKNLNKHSGTEKNYQDDISKLIQWENKFGEEIRDTLGGIFETLDETGDEGLSSAITPIITQSLDQGNVEKVNQLKTVIDSINWSNPLEGAYQLNQQVQYGTGLSKEYAKTLLDAGNQFFSLGSQMRFFVSSAQFTEISASLQEIVASGQEIQASDVLELADSYDSLNMIMETTGATAAGLAEMMELLANGDIGIYQLTDAVVASLAGFDSLNGVVASTLKSLQEFNFGPDENEVGDWMSNAYDILSKNLESGAVGNSQNFKILDFLFPGWDKGLEGDALVAEMDRLKTLIGNNSENMRRTWSDIAAGRDYQGKDISFDEGSGRSRDDVSIVDTGEEITLDIMKKGMTSADLVDWISDAYNVSKDMAQMMLTDFKNYSADLAQELEKNDYAAGIEKAYQKLEVVTAGDGKGQKEETRIIDQSEIEAIANLYGKTVEEVMTDLRSKSGELIVTSFYDDDGIVKNTAQIQGELNSIYEQAGMLGASAGSNWYDNFVQSQEGKKIIDIDAIDAELARLGVPESARQQIKEDIATSVKEGAGQDVPVELKTTMSDGSTKNIEFDRTINVSTAIANAEKEIENSGLAQAIATAFGNIKIGFSDDTGTLVSGVQGVLDITDFELNSINLKDQTKTELQEEIKTTVEGAEPETPVKATQDSLTDMGLDIDDVADDTRTVPIGADTTLIDSQLSSLERRTLTFTAKVISPHFAKGIKNSPVDQGDSLVAEEGPELIQKKDGTAYLAKDPQIANIEKGDTVYTAEETSRILNSQKGISMPRYASGYGYGNAYHGSGSSSNSKSSTRSSNRASRSSDVWENPYDVMHNTLERINGLLRERERLERRFQRLVQRGEATYKNMLKLQRETLANYEEEIERQKMVIDERYSQINDLIKSNPSMSKYITVIEDEFGDMSIQIDWDAINKITDEEQGEKVQKFYDEIKEYLDSIYDANTAIQDALDAIYEVEKRGQEEYINLENLAKDALVSIYQEQIDQLSELSDSISEANTKIIDSMQQAIDETRQLRENQKQEEDIADKQRRLAYLSQDTSGANQLEILQLQKEIDEATESYTDQLIDQKISELQQQNDEAAEQRERQIDIAQAQLDHWIESGQIWEAVYDLIDGAMDSEGNIAPNSDLMKILKDGASFKGMSDIQKMEWLTDIESKFAQALAWLHEVAMKKYYTGKKITFTTADGTQVTGVVQEDGSVKTDDGSVYKNVRMNANGEFSTTEEAYHHHKGNKGDDSTEWPSDLTKPSQLTSLVKKGSKGSAVKSVQTALDMLGYDLGSAGIDGNFGPKTDSAVRKFQGDSSISKDGKVGPQTREQFRLKGYQTGGLADFTGPAWLDGTKARPEYVLNAEQTKGFFQLIDVLGSLRNGTTKTSEISGDNTYDIDINVESIGSDYDVEQLAETVKRMINADARYRNNNTTSRMR